MTDRLAEIEAREKEATAGPWRAGRPDMLSYKLESGKAFKNVYTQVGTDEIQCETDLPIEDAQFIAHAREDIPWLVARVRRLEGALDTIATYQPSGNGPVLTAYKRWIEDNVRKALEGE